MKSSEWKTYRTRFLVKAKQLSSSLTFVDPLGRQHVGRKGDYLVESSEGVLSIAPRQIFEDIYVSMFLSEEPQPVDAKSDLTFNDETMDLRATTLPIEPLDIEEVSMSRKPVRRSIPSTSAITSTSTALTSTSAREPRLNDPARVRRKLPQPCRDRRAPSQPSRLSLM